MEFKKYPRIRVLGDKENEGILDDGVVHIEEKIDGANFRFMVRDGIIIFGSRSQQLTSNDGEDTNVTKNFVRCVKHVRDRMALAPKAIMKGIPSHLIFYGECCIKHSMNYDWEIIPAYLGFDIYDSNRELFLDYDKRECVFKALGLDMVPLIKTIDKSTKLDETDIPQSKYTLVQAEGIVIKNYDRQLFAKLVTPKFKEMNKKAFGLSKKQASNDDELLVSIYCTNARVDKMIFKMVDNGTELDIRMMPDLIRAVIKDMWEEAYHDIIKSQWTINFKTTNKLVAKRCMIVLKDVMINNSINKK